MGGAKEGPDPNRLEGLLECARSGMAPDELSAALDATDRLLAVEQNRQLVK